MSSFEDRMGDSWVFDLTFGTIERVKKDSDLDLLDSVQLNETLTTLLADPRRLVEVTYTILEPQIEKAGLSPEEFGSRIGGKQVGEISEALVEAWVHFFLQSGLAEQATAIQVTVENLKKMRTLMIQKAQDLDLSQEMEAGIDKEMQAIRKEFEKGFGS